MTDEHALEHVAKAIIDASLYMVLGTADHAGRPWVTPVYYAPAGYREFFWVSEPDAKHSRNLGERGEVSVVIFDSSVPIDTGQAVYVSASARELTGEECAKGIGVYSRRTLAHGGREWKPEDVQAPARHRLYRADAVALYVLDPQDRRVLVTIEKGAAEAAS
jgi:nitroimidazol reductase NimA-like FMN-containing flavoprotein (pyridoxamine 5'-phosphate oxidase superfamily)